MGIKRVNVHMQKDQENKNFQQGYGNERVTQGAFHGVICTGPEVWQEVCSRVTIIYLLQQIFAFLEVMQ